MTTEVSSARSQPSLRHAWYVVGVLMLVYVFSFVDRQVFSLLVDPLRRDLDISDTQVSLLMGLSFALFYTCFGIPIGRLADTYSRRGIIAIGLLLWSLLTAACGLAGSYSQMLFLRMGVGVGEAALSPAAYSLITDLFPREKLASAISLYSMGIYIGMGLAYLLGGLVVGYAATHAAWDLPLVGPIRPWQLIFFFIGLPGLALLPLLATVREPPRQRKSAAPMREVLSYVFANRRTVLLHNVGFGFMSLSAYATFAWVPEFYRRAFQWDIRTTGLVYGVIVLVFGSLGITGAGRLVDRIYARGRENAALFVAVVIAILWIPFNVLLFLSPSATWATLWLVPATLLGAAPFGIAPTAIQQIMPPTMRGQASAVYLFVLALIGLGIGPTAVAIVTQFVFGRDDALGYSLAIVTSSACAVSALLLSQALEPFLRSLERLRVWSDVA